MSYTLIFLAVLMAVVVTWLVKQTVNLRPWAAHDSTEAVRSEGVHSPGATTALHSTKLALGVFLAVVTSLFALFISAYSIRMEYGDWRPLPEPAVLWLNSGVLILSSVFLQHAWHSAKQYKLDAVRFGVAVGGMLALAFLVGQLIAWNQLISTGYLIDDNPANAFFYLLTALHGLHLLGGMVALGKTVKRVWHSDDMPAIQLGVELCAVYWHYLLAVWVILFGLMLST